MFQVRNSDLMFGELFPVFFEPLEMVLVVGSPFFAPLSKVLHCLAHLGELLAEEPKHGTPMDNQSGKEYGDRDYGFLVH